MKTMQTIIEDAKKIQCLVTDLDGVLTNGEVYYGDTGESFKKFNVKDGLGLKLLAESGVQVAVITGSKTPIVTERVAALDIKHIYQGCINKIEAYEDLLKKLNLTDESIAYVGDDWPDLPLIRRAKLGITPANGIEAVQTEADWITSNVGGQGAIREVCDLILTAQGTYPEVLVKYGL